jgi:hypothetical protein
MKNGNLHVLNYGYRILKEVAHFQRHLALYQVQSQFIIHLNGSIHNWFVFKGKNKSNKDG